MKPKINLDWWLLYRNWVCCYYMPNLLMERSLFWTTTWPVITQSIGLPSVFFCSGLVWRNTIDQKTIPALSALFSLISTCSGRTDWGLFNLGGTDLFLMWFWYLEILSPLTLEVVQKAHPGACPHTISHLPELHTIDLSNFSEDKTKPPLYWCYFIFPFLWELAMNTRGHTRIWCWDKWTGPVALWGHILEPHT